MHLYIHAHTHAYTCARKHTHARTLEHTHTGTYIHTYMHTHTHTYTHTHTHTHKHTCNSHSPTYVYVCTYITYVAGFGKTCIGHTSNFPHSRIHKIWKKQCTDLKYAEMIEEW